MPADPDRLVDVPLFAGLSRDELERVAAWLDTRHAIVETGRRTATVTASSPLDYYAMWGGDFRLLEREQPRVANSIRQAVIERLTGATETP